MKILVYIVLAFVGAAGLSLWQYYFSSRKINWVAPALFRFITYFSLLILLINPKVEQQTLSLEKPILALVVDNSRSIAELEDTSRVKEFILKLKNHSELNKKFELTEYRFGENFSRLDSLNFSESQTHISTVFSQLSKIYKREMAPTVILTDGNQTLGQDYVTVAQQYNQSVYPVVVGDTTSHSDIRIDHINSNNYAFLDNDFPVELFISYEGQEKVVKKLTIKENGNILFSRDIELAGGKSAEVVMAKLKADRIGTRIYEAEIEHLTDEKNIRNNTRKFAVEVMDQKTEVLLLAANPHPDLGALKKVIESNPQRSASLKYLSDEDLDLGKYQLLVLYQPTRAFEEIFTQIENLESNLLIITGTKTDYSFLNRKQNHFSKEISTSTEYYIPRFNANYQAFQLEDIGFSDFPPLKDVFGELLMHEEFDPLLFQQVSGVDLESPLLLSISEGNRKFGYLFGENTWQWRAKSYVDQDSFEQYDGFMGKFIQYLASNEQKERLSVSYDAFYNTGDKIILQAHYFDESYRFDPRAKLLAQVVNRETQNVKNYAFILKNNNYELDISGLEAGEYRFVVEVEGESSSKQGEFTLIDFDVEKQFLSANVDKLRQIATDSLYFLADPDTLIEDLVKSEDYKPVQKSKTSRSALINWKYLLYIIIFSLSAEWFIRKYSGLI